MNWMGLLLGLLVPLITFGSIALVVFISYYFHHRGRRLSHEAVMAAIERSGGADPQLIAAITHRPPVPQADLRRGLLLIAAALALVVLALASGLGQLRAPLLGLAAFPGLIGSAFILFHFIGARDPGD